MNFLKKHKALIVELLVTATLLYVLYRIYVGVKGVEQKVTNTLNPLNWISGLWKSVTGFFSSSSAGNGAAGPASTVLNSDGSTTTTLNQDWTDPVTSYTEYAGTSLTIAPEPPGGYGAPQFNWGGPSNASGDDY